MVKRWLLIVLAGMGCAMAGCASQKQYFRGAELSRLGPWTVEVREGHRRERFRCAYQKRTGSLIARMSCRSEAQIQRDHNESWRYGRAQRVR